MILQGLASELLAEIEKMPVIDCHEHLHTEAQRLAAKTDVTRFFSAYCRADLAGAGIPWDAAQDALFDYDKPLRPRWEMLKPALERIRYGSYAYPAFAYVRDVLGFDDINDETFEAISARLQADVRPGFYRRILAGLCGIEWAIQCKNDIEEGDQDFFAYLCRDRTYKVPVHALERETDRSIGTLDAFVDALHEFVRRSKQRGAVGYKVGAAYGRKIEFSNVPRGDAERAFAKLRSGRAPGIPEGEREALENYLMRRAVESCIEADMPVVIHTGYQAGLGNDIRNARAVHLWSLLKDYPQARFDLFHGSFPYVEDLTCLGKYFPNVVLDMCWMHLMGPGVSRRALSQWLDAVPVSRIFAFGGDDNVVENVYGHLKLARADVAAVLAEKVEEGRFGEGDAAKIAKMLFYDNPKQWYRLGC